MYWREYFAGVDEVGRGPLAGAVLAAAVVLDPFVGIPGLRDSKKLSEKRRERLYDLICDQALDWSVGRAEVEEIDEINILNASLLAMSRAVAGLTLPIDYAVIDGNRLPELKVDADWLIKGDDRLDAIKAASVIAKVTRDREMKVLDIDYPGYGLAGHKGYPTRVHLEALKKLGPSAIHRMAFGPCRQSKLS